VVFKLADRLIANPTP